MIYRSIYGAPIPVGARFRQREVYAERVGSIDRHRVPWTVSVVDSLNGETIEAKTHLEPSAIVATDIAKHSMIDDVLRQTREVLDDEGWTWWTVDVCDIAGCGEPLPMWKCGGVEGRRTPRECFACAARTIRECVECGAPDSGRWAGREALLAEQVCFSCGLWRSRVAEQYRDDVVITPEFEVYSIGSGSGPKSSHGFGGARFVVTFDDGRRVETDDLWSGGTVPGWFRDRIRPNGQLTTPETVKR